MRTLEQKIYPDSIINDLYNPPLAFPVGKKKRPGISLPSAEVLAKVVNKLKMVLFPEYFGSVGMGENFFHNSIALELEDIKRLLSNQIIRGYGIMNLDNDSSGGYAYQTRADDKIHLFFLTLPKIRKILFEDIIAAYNGDPAAKSIEEVIGCYPSCEVMISFRVAHELYRLGIPIIPRIITEIAHSKTGIDIHPGAKIGTSFFIDHGTGVVIGETCKIGKNVRIYQGVTLGAKSFYKDQNGYPEKGIMRHPLVEDDVIIYSGATILGCISIGRGSVIGGNVWITKDVPPGSLITQRQNKESFFQNGSGI